MGSRENKINTELVIIFRSFIKSINQNNYLDKYSELEKLILKHKNSYTKTIISVSLQEAYQKITLHDYQDDVILEIENRINGNCSDFKRIILND